MLKRHSKPLKEWYNMHTIVHSISNFYISVLSWIEYLRVIAALLIKAPFDNAALHCTLIYLFSFIIYVVVIFSPFLLTNKIVIIENITLSREAVFKRHLKYPFAETGRPHAQRVTLSEWGACVYAYFSMCVAGWVCKHIWTHIYCMLTYMLLWCFLSIVSTLFLLR